MRRQSYLQTKFDGSRARDAEILAELRRDRKLTVVECAKRRGVAQSFISKVLARARERYPDLLPARFRVDGRVKAKKP